MHEHAPHNTDDADTNAGVEPPAQPDAAGYTDFDGQPQPLAPSTPATTAADPHSATRQLPVVPTPLLAAEQPHRVAGRRSGRFASLAVIVALVVGLLAGGAGGYAFGNRGGNGSAVAAISATTDAIGENAAANGTATNVTPVASPAALSDLVARVNPAVVTIEGQVSSQDAFGQAVDGTQTGSGYIIDTDGHIVTNNHVVEGAKSLKVTFSDGTQTTATVVGTDAFQDVAVVKVDGPVPATVAFGDSDQVRSGDPVVAIGSALGEFHNSVTNGIVSGTQRSLDTGQGYRLANLIQHNASISPGNSGGPLLNDKGEVIGMNTAVVRGNGASAEGLGFAIASNTVKKIADELIQTGQADYPYMGVQFTVAQGAQATDGSANMAVTLTQVTSGGPAAQAGLKVGDTITAVDGVQISDEQPFLNLVFAHQVGDTVQFSVTPRGGQATTVAVTMAARPATP